MAFYNPYMPQGNYLQELNNMRDRIDAQIQQAQQQQIPQPTNLTQNFQIAPNTTNNFRIANGVEDVKREMVIADTYFLAKDNSNLWIKNTRGDIRTFELTEVNEKDEKDLLIENLQRQINELKGSAANDTTKQYAEPTNTTSNNAATETKPANVQYANTSKTKKHKYARLIYTSNERFHPTTNE